MAAYDDSAEDAKDSTVGQQVEDARPNEKPELDVPKGTETITLKTWLVIFVSQ